MPDKRAKEFAIRAILALAIATVAHGQNFPTVINTVAGGGFPPDNVAATASEVNPNSVAVDGAGNLFIADAINNRIRKVDTSGNITTVAGSGIAAFVGDGGPATSAGLDLPRGVAIDSAGNLFIADADNNRIRKVDHATQVITTVAGGGGFFSSGDGGPAIGAGMFPVGVAVDGAGNLFIADVGSNRIRKVDHATQIITTVAGGGSSPATCMGSTDSIGDGCAATSASLNNPFAVTVDSAGNLFVADSGHSRIRKVDQATQIITTVAGGGSSPATCTGSTDSIGDGCAATSASLFNPEGVAVDTTGNLFIADSSNSRIRKVNQATQVITTLAGNGNFRFFGDGGPAASAVLNFPTGPVVDSAGNLFIVDRENNRIRKVDTGGIINTVAGNGARTFLGDGGAATSAGLQAPEGVTRDSAGNLFIADSRNDLIRKVDRATQIITTVAGGGSSPGTCTGSTNSIGDGCAATSASVGGPFGVTVDSAGNLLIADLGNNAIRKVDHATQIITTVAGGGSSPSTCTGSTNSIGDGCSATSASLFIPEGVAVDGAGNLFIADTFDNRIRKVDQATQIITTVAGNGNSGFSGDGGPATSASLDLPSGVTVDGAGNLFIADRFNGVIRRVDHATQIITTVAGGGSSPNTCMGSTNSIGDGCTATSAVIFAAGGVAVDGAGNLFIADIGNNRIRKVDNGTQIITTVTGNGTQDFSGDGGPATSASLNGPSGVTVDGAGNVLIADTSNFRIRKVITFPVANAQSLTTAQGTPLNINLTGASPRGSVSLTFSIVAGPSNGTLSNLSPSAGTVTYTPASGFNGADRFTFKVNDGNVDSAAATVALTVTPAPPDFAIAANPSSATIRAGQSATFTFTVTPAGGFSNAVSFSCSGLPALSTCTFTPTSVTPNGSAATVTLVVKTTGPNASLQTPSLPGNKPQPLLALWQLSGSLGIIGLVLAGSARGFTRDESNSGAALLGVVAFLVLLTTLGCGGNSTPPPPPQTPAGTSTVVVTGLSGSTSHAANVTLTVTQ